MKIELEGGCFVIEKEDLSFKSKENWNEAEIIGKKSGSKALSQYYFDISPGITPIRSFANADCVLFVLNGKGIINISGKKFEITAETGIYVKPNEAFSFETNEKLEMIATVCPETSASWPTKMPGNFDISNRKRTVSLRERKMVATGDRFYQLLVGKKMGSRQVTQFIGSIPKSKAPDHFHLYEEAITILKGNGYMWAGNQKAPVNKGSLIFLPRKQVHCMECKVDEGLKLMGTFYPSGSPAVSYKD